MTFYDFEFDGLRLSDKGFVVCKFGSDETEIISNGSYITFNTVSMMHGSKHELVSLEYSNCLTATFQICKSDCKNGVQEISSQESRDIMKWLNRKGFYKFKILNPKGSEDLEDLEESEDFEYSDIYFEASFNISKITKNGKVYGFELEVITNRPYAIHEPITLSISLRANQTYNIISESDEEGYIYPEMRISVSSSGNFELYNALEDRSMYIANCRNGEIITINYPIIETSVLAHKIQNDFNWKFFRIANTFSNNVNSIMTSLPCTITIKYSPIVKVGIV